MDQGHRDKKRGERAYSALGRDETLLKVGQRISNDVFFRHGGEGSHEAEQESSDKDSGSQIVAVVRKHGMVETQPVNAQKDKQCAEGIEAGLLREINGD